MIHYCIGDATYPNGIGNMIIPHICNDIGGWGAGFVLAISKRWKLPEQKYYEWYKSNNNFQSPFIIALAGRPASSARSPQSFG